MEGSQKFAQDVRDAVAEVAPESELRLERTDIYFGANPLTNRSTIIFRIRTDAASFSTPKVRKLLEGRFGLRLQNMSFATGVSSSEKAAAFVAAVAAALLARDLHIGPDHGARARPDGSADCWIEFLLGLPAGPMLSAALKTALVAVAAAAAGKDLNDAKVEQHLEQLKELCWRNRPKTTSQYLITVARAIDLPYMSLARTKMYWQFGWGSRGRIFLGSACNDDGYAGFNIAKFKTTAKHMFRELGVPTPRWSELVPGGDPAEAIARVGFPCVVKPADSSLGEGVTANISTMAQYHAAVALARGKWDRKLVVESHLPGDDHRLMVIEGRLFAAVRRDLPVVIGDGASSVRQLIERMNASRLGAPDEAGFLSPVKIDSALLLRLQDQRISLETILPPGEPYFLRTVANRSAGGSAVDVTARVHPQVRAWAEQLAKTIGLRVTGIDYVTPDIAADPLETGGGFIEINATPGLQVLEAAGLDRIAIGRAVLGKEPGRIPVDLVLTEPTRIEELLSRLPRQEGHAIAWPTGMEIDGSFAYSKGLTPFEIAGAVLRNRSVDGATFIWTLEEMMTFGLPVDRIRRTTLAGTVPQDKWNALLKRISKQVVVSDDLLVAKAGTAKPRQRSKSEVG